MLNELIRLYNGDGGLECVDEDAELTVVGVIKNFGNVIKEFKKETGGLLIKAAKHVINENISSVVKMTSEKYLVGEH